MRCTSKIVSGPDDKTFRDCVNFVRGLQKRVSPLVWYYNIYILGIYIYTYIRRPTQTTWAQNVVNRYSHVQKLSPGWRCIKAPFARICWRCCQAIRILRLHEMQLTGDTYLVLHFCMSLFDAKTQDNRLVFAFILSNYYADVRCLARFTDGKDVFNFKLLSSLIINIDSTPKKIRVWSNL